MTILLCAPLVLQGLFITIDEFIFHRKRGLPKWEIWGHPLDTLTVAIVYGMAVFIPYSQDYFWTYVALAVFSTIFVTKDEFVHAKRCEPLEHWLHAVLFILHPTAFICTYFLWTQNLAPDFLKGQFFLVVSFLIYQVLYWGKPWKIQLHTQTK